MDGASRGNPGPAGIGVVLLDGDGTAREFSKSLGRTTNNVAEYAALLYGLQEALHAGCTAVTVKTDSELLARQVNGQYKVRDQNLRLLHDLAKHLLGTFETWRIVHIPRIQNAAADRLAGRAAEGRETPALP